MADEDDTGALGRIVGERLGAAVPRGAQAVILSGLGSPAGVVKAPRGASYHRKDGGAGTTLYVKEGGATAPPYDAEGWEGK